MELFKFQRARAGWVMGLAVWLAAAGVTAAGPADQKAAEAQALYQQAKDLLHERLDDAALREAIGILEKASQLDPNSEAIWIEIAWRYWMVADALPKKTGAQKEVRLKLFEKGMAAGGKAKALNPRSVGGLYWYTVNMASAGEMRGVLSSLSMGGTLFGNMSRVDRRDPYFLYGATRRFGSELYVRIPAFLSRQFGFTSEYVVEDLQANVERWPNYFDNYNFLARVYWWAEDKENALKQLEYVLGHDPAAMPEEQAENRRQQDFARQMWKEWTGKEYPGR